MGLVLEFRYRPMRVSTTMTTSSVINPEVLFCVNEHYAYPKGGSTVENQKKLSWSGKNMKLYCAAASFGDIKGIPDPDGARLSSSSLPVMAVISDRASVASI